MVLMVALIFLMAFHFDLILSASGYLPASVQQLLVRAKSRKFTTPSLFKSKPSHQSGPLQFPPLQIQEILSVTSYPTSLYP